MVLMCKYDDEMVLMCRCNEELDFNIYKPNSYMLTQRMLKEMLWDMIGSNDNPLWEDYSNLSIEEIESLLVSWYVEVYG